MKQFLLKSWVLLACLLVGVGTSWAEVSTYQTGNWPTKGYTTKGGKVTNGDVEWTYSSSTYIGSSGQSIQVGSANNPQTTAWTISAPISSFGEGAIIKSVTIYAKTTNTTATYDISVGGESKKSGNLSTSFADYEAKDLSVSAGNVVITLKGSTKSAAMYLASIKVTYETNTPVDPVDASWSVSPSEIAVKTGKVATATITTNYNGTLAVASNNTGVATATIEGKVITVTGVAEGATTLTVTGDATSAYNAITKTIDVTVTANTRPANEIFYESFDTNDGTGGNDNQWSGNIASNNIESDIFGWNFVQAKGADKCAKFGTGSNPGSATTPELDYTGDAILSFKAAAWNGREEITTISLSATNDVVLSETSIELTKAEWSDYVVTLTGVTPGTQITFAASEGNNRFFLDEVSIVALMPITFSATDGDAYYATFSSDKAVKFDDATTVYAVSANGGALSLNEITSKEVPANTGVLLKNSGKTATYSYVASAAAVEGNMLQPASKDKAELTNHKFYMLGYKDNTKDPETLGFYWGAAEGAAFTSRTGSAYLAIPSDRAGVRGFSLRDMDATGIEAISEATGNKQQATAYNLQGQRVNASAKGIVIVNGKKYFVK